MRAIVYTVFAGTPDVDGKFCVISKGAIEWMSLDEIKQLIDDGMVVKARQEATA